MVQIYEKLYELEAKQAEEKAVQKVNEQEVDESLGALNPRYYELVMSLKDAKRMMDSSYQVLARMNLNSPY